MPANSEPAKGGTTSSFNLSNAVATAMMIVSLPFAADEIVRTSLGDYFLRTNPSLALSFDRSRGSARAVIAQSILVEDRSRLVEAEAELHRALFDAPLSAGVLDIVSRASQVRGDEGGAEELIRLANRVDKRDLHSLLRLLDRDLRGGAVKSALLRIDTILRGQPSEVIERLTPTLAPIVASEPYRQGFATLLAEGPPWRSYWFGEVVARAQSSDDVEALFNSVQTGVGAATKAELKAFLDRMVKDGRLEAAYVAWRKALQSSRRNDPDLLYNSGLNEGLTNLPFDWVITPVPEAIAEVETVSDERILRVEFFGGQVRFANVSHFLRLPPGEYKLTALEKADSLQNERGLAWRVSCVGARETSLGTSELLKGDVAWREMNVAFVVPDEDCVFQQLVLELPARAALEYEITGGASYRSFALLRK